MIVGIVIAFMFIVAIIRYLFNRSIVVVIICVQYCTVEYDVSFECFCFALQFGCDVDEFRIFV